MSSRVATGLMDRRRAVLVARHRRRRTMLLGAVTLSAAVTGTWWVGTGPLLSITNVNISGYDHPDQANLVRTIQIASREGTMLRLPTVSVREAATRFAWVADVRVHHNWPRGIDVQVIPAKPVAVARADDGRRLLVADSGRVLGDAGDGSAALPTYRMPAADVGTWLRGAAQRAPFEFLTAMSPATARKIQDLRVEGGVVIGRLVSGPALRVGSPHLLFAKARAVEAVLSNPKLEAHLAEATYLDVSSPKRPVLDRGNASVETSTEGQGSDVSEGEGSSTT